MHERIIVFIVPITFIIAVAVVLYVYIQSRHRERMAMIEKGYDAGLLEGTIRNRTGKFSALKIGMAGMGVGFGFLVGSILDSATAIDDGVAYFSMSLLFGGLSLVIYYLLMRNKEAL